MKSIVNIGFQRSLSIPISRELVGTIFKDDKFPDTCPVRTIITYQSKKTPDQSRPDQRFMLNVKMSAENEPAKQKYWYAGVMGKNQIASLFKTAFEELGKS